ncbi:SMI1/KNR4 family protein [Streptomyces yangpuensis]|uniref:SMI1/KNR4 family protein n=1 Tax=Streptomyces yangpuensis TaxID=1648182 RepID=UPI00382F27E3
MSQPAVTRLRQLLPPPARGGDVVDRERLTDAAQLELPRDYREFVESYGGGEIDEYLSVSTPPVPGSPYGDLLDRVDPALPDRYRQELGALLGGEDVPLLLPFADSASSDVAFWLRKGAADSWTVATFRRQAPAGANPWTVFDGGMAEFCLAILTGTVHPFSERIAGSGPHVFVSWRDV